MYLISFKIYWHTDILPVLLTGQGAPAGGLLAACFALDTTK